MPKSVDVQDPAVKWGGVFLEPMGMPCALGILSGCQVNLNALPITILLYCLGNNDRKSQLGMVAEPGVPVTWEAEVGELLEPGV